jgi:hypothetical protein
MASASIVNNWGAHNVSINADAHRLCAALHGSPTGQGILIHGQRNPPERAAAVHSAVGVHLGFDRIAASETEAPNTSVNLV